jgi:hypothetical protein
MPKKKEGLIINDHDKSICKWSEQVDGMCPYNELLNMLLNSMSKKKTRCKNKECLLVAKDLGITSEEELLQRTGQEDLKKPGGPAYTTRLLSQFNIEDVMHDLSWASVKKDGPFKNGPFYHIKFEMRDFADSVVSELRDIDLEKLRAEGFRSFGCVLNTDYWAGPGKHWVCIYGTLRVSGFTKPEDRGDSRVSGIKTPKDVNSVDDLSSAEVEYFNSSSNGLENFPELKTWALKKNVSIKAVVKEPLQYSDTECGVWCLTYIKSRLEGHPPDYFKKFNVSDEDIIGMRRYLFT